jgi:hemerythrin-like domain-containing protein
MLLIDRLRAEHGRIDPMVGSLRTYVARRVRGEADPADAARYVAFFRSFADSYHHAREEGVLLPALVRELQLPGDRGPIAAITSDHVRMRALFGEIAGLLGAPLDEVSAARLQRVTGEWSRALWLHIDAENSVLFPECEERLPRAGVFELEERAPTEEETRAGEDAAALLLLHPPNATEIDRDLVRGEGCAICPNFGVSCDGIEREWWSELEWDEFPDRVG